MRSALTTLKTPAVRPLLAKNVKVGDMLAVQLPEHGARPVRVVGVDLEDPDGIITLALETVDLGGTYRGSWPAESELVALPTHYGVCHQCGQLTPCPDELNERLLEIWWLNPPSPIAS